MNIRAKRLSLPGTSVQGAAPVLAHGLRTLGLPRVIADIYPQTAGSGAPQSTLPA